MNPSSRSFGPGSSRRTRSRPRTTIAALTSDPVSARRPIESGLDVRGSQLVVAAPGADDGYWAGAPSAVSIAGAVYLAYRLRRPVAAGRGYANVVAVSTDGLGFRTLCVVSADDLGCASLERPALVRRPDGGWRLYVSLSTPNSKHWRIDALDADTPDGLADGRRVTVWPGDEATAVKDPVVVLDPGGGWHAWICCHPLTEPGQEDRMTTRYAHSDDGHAWTWGDVVLTPPSTGWDRRGRRVAAITRHDDGTVTGYYDGRADAAENWYERTGIVRGRSIGGPLESLSPRAPAQSPHGRHTLRYVTVADLGDGTRRAYFEAAAADGSNEIRTQVIALNP